MYPSWDMARWTQHPPRLEGGIYRVFESAFAQYPTRAALIDPAGHTFSYRELGRRVEAVRVELANSGVVSGDRVLGYVQKSPAGVLLYLACLSRGAVYIPVNPDYTATELQRVVRDARPQLVVCDSSRRRRAVRCAPESVVGTLGADGEIAIRSSRQPTPAPFRQNAANGNDPAVVLYTSGTTGKPRGVVLSHRAVLANGVALCRVWGMVSEDVLLHALPLFHTHGLLVALNCALLTGASIIFMPAFDAHEAIGLLGRSTVFMGVPTYYTRLLAQGALTRRSVAGMRLFTCGSAPLLPQVWEEFHSRTGHRIVERYGMTEVGIITSNPLDGPRVAGTVGFPLEGVEIKLVSQAGAEAPTGTVGELHTKSAGVFSGYLNHPVDASPSHRAGGWVRTGDLGSVDAEGRVTLVGRAKDLVITGGLNVHPLEVETALKSLAEVVDSAVFGVPHPDFGEAVVAAVVRHGEGKTTPRFLQSRLSSQLAGYKIPKEILFVDHLPRNAMGKVQKQVLRSEHSRLFT